MNRLIKILPINSLLIISLLCTFYSYSQAKYSKFALTGRGDINLEGETFKLQKEVFEAFTTMQQAALKDGISIKIVSAYRSFNQQKKIWNRKYFEYTSEGLSPEKTIEKIIEYSTLPSTSRHHWGTDIDIVDGFISAPNDLLIEENYSDNGVYEKLKNWMDKHAQNFGFYLVYTNTENRKGFKYEPWHYSYKKISKPMLKAFIKLDLGSLLDSINLEGKHHLSSKFMNEYISKNVLDINSELK